MYAVTPLLFLIILLAINWKGCLGDGVSDQIKDYGESQKGLPTPKVTTGFGAPVDSLTACLSVGKYGPLLYDTVFLERMAKMDRERIPDRIVHAKGTGAFGHFETTHNLSNYSKANIFKHVGKQIKVAVRFSLAITQKGGADTNRDIGGFAVKFYTEEGNFDIVGFTIPLLFIRDPMLFPQVAHAFQKNPVTNIQDLNVFWDLITSRPEIYASIFWFFSDFGTPNGYRHTNGYGVNTYKLVNERGDYFWCKFHFRTKQGVKNFNAQQAKMMTADDPDYFTRDLYNAIYSGNFPAWKFYIQVMTPEEGTKAGFNIFDPTRSWPMSKYPLIEAGELVLNKNPKNNFAEVEQLAFYPGSLIPGIEPSLDKTLQGRIFAYSDTQRHRLGSNYQQLPVNRPIHEFHNYDRDGKMAYYNQDDAPNYYPNSFHGPQPSSEGILQEYYTNGTVGRFDLGDDDNYSEPRGFYNSLDDAGKESFVTNIAQSLNLTYKFIQEKAVGQLKQINEDLGSKVADKLNIHRIIISK